MVVTIRHSINDITTNTRTFILQINETSVPVNTFVSTSDHGWMRLCCSSSYHDETGTWWNKTKPVLPECRL